MGPWARLFAPLNGSFCNRVFGTSAGVPPGSILMTFWTPFWSKMTSFWLHFTSFGRHFALKTIHWNYKRSILEYEWKFTWKWLENYKKYYIREGRTSKHDVVSDFLCLQLSIGKYSCFRSCVSEISVNLGRRTPEGITIYFQRLFRKIFSG